MKMLNNLILYNKRIDRMIPSIAVYIGRPSKWGNPFKVSSAISPVLAVQLYEKWIVTQPVFAKIHELKGKDLICWCTPEPCHGEVLIRLANQ